MDKASFTPYGLAWNHVELVEGEDRNVLEPGRGVEYYQGVSIKDDLIRDGRSQPTPQIGRNWCQQNAGAGCPGCSQGLTALQSLVFIRTVVSRRRSEMPDVAPYSAHWLVPQGLLIIGQSM